MLAHSLIQVGDFVFGVKRRWPQRSRCAVLSGSRRFARGPKPVLPADPAAEAREAGLKYSTDQQPGITRVSSGKVMRYRDRNGREIRDSGTLARIKALAVPPAWTDVWICPWSDGHIQATGRDARRRKQYRYHARWRSHRDSTKYERMAAFGHASRRFAGELPDR